MKRSSNKVVNKIVVTMEPKLVVEVQAFYCRYRTDEQFWQLDIYRSYYCVHGLPS